MVLELEEGFVEVGIGFLPVLKIYSHALTASVSFMYVSNQYQHQCVYQRPLGSVRRQPLLTGCVARSCELNCFMVQVF